MRLDTQCTKAHGTCHKVLHDTLHWLHLVDRCGLGGFFEAEEVADKDGTLLFVNDFGPILEFIVVALTGGQL